MILVHWLGQLLSAPFSSLLTALRGQVIHSFHFGLLPPREHHAVFRTPTTQMCVKTRTWARVWCHRTQAHCRQSVVIYPTA